MSYLLDTNVFIQAKNLHYGFDFCPAFWDWLDEKLADALTKVSEWARGGSFDASAANTFLQIADSFLVAEALATGATVVTHEVPASGKKIKIPTACIALGVSYCNPFQMLRREHASFVLGKSVQ